MKLILLLTMFLLIEWDIKPTCGVDHKFCVSQQITQISKLCQNGSWIEWSTIIFNTEKYFNSNTRLHFLPQVYKLNESLLIRSVQNLTLVGMESSPFTIKCDGRALLSVSHSAFVQVINTKFQNCGMNIHSTNAAIILSNVTSVTISNITFENTHGHAIIGINLIGYSVLRHIKIFDVHSNSTSDRASEIEYVFTGGFILTYYNVTSNEDFMIEQNHTVLIEHCSIFSVVQQKKEFNFFRYHKLHQQLA